MSLNQEIINNVYKNAHIALQSISNIMPETFGNNLRQELQAEYDGYEKIIGNISEFMSQNNFQPKDVNFMKKAMLYTSIKMNTLTDDSTSHIADLMVKGTVMGITELKQIISRSDSTVMQEILQLANQLLEFEEGCEKRLKEFL